MPGGIYIEIEALSGENDLRPLSVQDAVNDQLRKNPVMGNALTRIQHSVDLVLDILGKPITVIANEITLVDAGGLPIGVVSDHISYTANGITTIINHSSTPGYGVSLLTYTTTGTLVPIAVAPGVIGMYATLNASGALTDARVVISGSLGAGQIELYSGTGPAVVVIDLNANLGYIDSPSYKRSGTTIIDSNGRWGTDFAPATDNTYDLGTASYMWNDIRLKGTLVHGSNTLVDASRNADFVSLSIGGTSVINSGRNASFVSLTINGTGMIDSSRQFQVLLKPDTDDSLDLGTSSLQWQDLYLSGVIYVDGSRVVKERLSSITAVPSAVGGTAGAAYGATEQTMLNDLKSAVNTLITVVGEIRDRLRVTTGHGLVSD